MDFSPTLLSGPPRPAQPSPPSPSLFPRSAHRARAPSRARARRGPPQLPAAAQRGAPPSPARAPIAPASLLPACARKRPTRASPTRQGARPSPAAPRQHLAQSARTSRAQPLDRARSTPSAPAAAAARWVPHARTQGATVYLLGTARRTVSSARRPVFSPRTPAIPCAVLAHRCFASPNRSPERRRRRAGRLPLAVEVSSPRPLSPSPSYLPLDAPSRPSLFSPACVADAWPSARRGCALAAKFSPCSVHCQPPWSSLSIASFLRPPSQGLSCVRLCYSPPASAQPSSFAHDWIPCRRESQHVASRCPGVQTPRALALLLRTAAST
jgi:hypothetical protein